MMANGRASPTHAAAAKHILMGVSDSSRTLACASMTVIRTDSVYGAMAAKRANCVHFGPGDSVVVGAT